jgi:hypothetical protein
VTRAPDEAALLTVLLEAEHAVVYGYGALGARLDDETRRTALAASDAHRSRRDALTAALVRRGEPAPGPEPAYDVAVADAAQGRALAVRLEEGMAVRWRDLVGGTDDVELRRLGLSGLQDAAVRAATWRRLSGAPAVTEALPGTS